ANTDIDSLSLHDALPISSWSIPYKRNRHGNSVRNRRLDVVKRQTGSGTERLDHAGLLSATDEEIVAYAHREGLVVFTQDDDFLRSEEHTSELQSRENLVC